AHATDRGSGPPVPRSPWPGGAHPRRATEHRGRSTERAIRQAAGAGPTAIADRAGHEGIAGRRRDTLIRAIAGRATGLHGHADGSGPRCARLAAVSRGRGPSGTGIGLLAGPAGRELLPGPAPLPDARRGKTATRSLGARGITALTGHLSYSPLP